MAPSASVRLPARARTRLAVATAIVVLAGLLPPASVLAAGSISLTTSGLAYTQDFDTLAASATSSVVPNGWAFSESGTNANTTYTAGTGSSTTGDTYSFGLSAATERAFGGLRSGALVPMIGAQFINDTGGAISQLDVAYTGEQWRLGQNTAGRAADRLDFQLSTDATSLTTGTWTDVDALDFSSPVVAGTVGALNGNVAPNRTAVASSITGLAIVDGATFWIRWADTDLIPGSDDGLAVDDFSLTPTSVVEPETAPEVGATTPADGATGVAIDASISITFSEPVDVSGNWYFVVCDSGLHYATVSGGPTTYTIDPDFDYTTGDNCDVFIDHTLVTDQDTNDPPDTMAADYIFHFHTATDPCNDAFTPIYAIQGSGPSAAITGTVTTSGIVVGDNEGPSPNLRGFYLQDETGDADASTSDGIFVFEGNGDTVSLGDRVSVTGTAAEFQDQTQISATSITNCGTGTISPTDVTLPFASLTQAEQWEGMLVRLPQTLSVTEHFQLGRFGQVTLSSGGTLDVPTNVTTPGAAANALQAANNLNRIIVDDALQNQNPDPILFGRGGNPLSASNTLRGGDTATGIVGVMTYTWAGNGASPNAYRVRPINALGGGVPNFVAANARPVGTPAPGGSIQVAAMNLLNFFNTFTGCTGGVGGAPLDCRGANNATEYDRQSQKTVAAILASGADAIGVNEIENDGYGPTSAIQDLVNKLNAATAPATWAFIDVDAATGQVNALGTDAIKVGMIYQPAHVTPVGQTAALNTVAFVNGGDPAPRSRPALAQSFEDNVTGGRVTMVVNHLKSKGSACSLPDQLDGQGNCNQVRVNAATELVAWIATNPTGIADSDVLVMGDLNSYAMEDPVKVITDAGYTNLIASLVGPDAYSYLFDGQFGYLDHALGSPSVVSQVAGIVEWHIDSDEPAVLDYNTEFKSAGQVASLYAPDQYRISDHDPVIVGLDLADNPPTADAGGPYFVTEGLTTGVSASGSDPDGHAISYAWDLDDNGSFETAGQSVSFDAAGLTAPLTRTIHVQVTDAFGATAVDAATVYVTYPFSGFLSPVDDDVVNSVKAGVGVPIKFSLSGDRGLDIFAAGSPTSASYVCEAGAPTDPIETTAAGGSSLAYDAATDTYTYVWKTQKAWAGTCRVFILKLDDNATYTAEFKFLK